MNSGRVLVVDDVESNRYLVGSVLRRAGYDVTEAATGREALQRMSAQFDVVILDVHLPDMSGLDVCAAIKGNAGTAHVPVMHTSATAIEASDRTAGLNGGADAYVIEPLEPDELLATVRALARTGAAARRGALLAGRLQALAAASLSVPGTNPVLRLVQAAASGASEVFDVPAVAGFHGDDGVITRVISPAVGEPVFAQESSAPLVSTAVSWPAAVDFEDLPAAWRQAFVDAGVTKSSWFSVAAIGKGGEAVGWVAIALPAGASALEPSDRRVLRQLTDAYGVALENMRMFAREHHVALTLQRSLLPERFPDVPGLSFAARYQASGEQASVGGDFYDTFLLPDGSLAAVIGDVQGHSLFAATVMAELRFSLRAYLLEGHPPATALRLLDELLVGQHPEETATVCVVIVEPGSSSALVTNAGHLPPLVVTEAAATYATESGLLLGACEGEGPTVRIDFPPGATLVLVTDGLVERRSRSMDDMLDEMQVALAPFWGAEPDAVCDMLLERFDAADGEDDIAVLVLRRS